MKKPMYKLFGALAITNFIPTLVLARSNYEYDLNTAEASGLLAGLGIFLLVFFLIGILSLVFWILMLIHAVKNDIPDKNLWIIILVVSFVAGLGLVGALVYYFAVKNKFDAPKKSLPKAKKSSKKTKS